MGRFVNRLAVEKQAQERTEQALRAYHSRGRPPILQIWVGSP